MPADTLKRGDLVYFVQHKKLRQEIISIIGKGLFSSL